MISDFPKLDFYGIKYSKFTREQLVNYCRKSLYSKKVRIFYGYGVGHFPYIKKYPRILNYCNSFNLLVNDGRILYYLAKLHGLSMNYSISVPSLVYLLLKIANNKNASIMLLGASEKINLKASKMIKIEYPNINVITGINGYFSTTKEKIIINKIESKSPDILFIGMPTPYKEEFAYKNKYNLNTKIIVPCGGMINVLAGDKKLSPNWIKKIGLAWLYRFVQEPKRRMAITSEFFLLFFKVFTNIILSKINLVKKGQKINDIL